MKDKQPVDKTDKKEIDPKELTKNSPHLKAMLDLVDGEIVGIKKKDDL